MEAYEDALQRSRSTDKVSKASEKASLLATPKTKPPPPRRYVQQQQIYVEQSKPFYKRPMLVWACVFLVIIGLAVATVLIALHAKDSSHTEPASNATSSSASPSLVPMTSQTTTEAPPPAAPTPTSVKPFYGIGYEPPGLLSGCNFTPESVQSDVQLLSTITTRLRIYNSICDQSTLVLQAIDALKLPMTVAVGIDITTGTSNDYIINQTYFQSEMKSALALVQKYPTLIEALIVGNEVLLKFAAMQQPLPIQQLVSYINTVRSQVQALKLQQDIPIGTSEAPVGLTPTNGQPATAVVNAVDVLYANIHPWWGGSPGSGAAASLNSQWQSMIQAFPGQQPGFWVLGESGWPASLSNETTFYEQSGAQAGSTVANLQTYIDGWICQWNQQGLPYYFFEAIDEPDKAPESDPSQGVENHWGLYTVDRVLKPGLTLPDCAAP